MLSKSWKLSFKIKPHGIANGPRDILSLFENQAEKLYLLFLGQTNRLSICAHSFGTGCYAKQTSLPLHKLTTITVQQIRYGNQYHIQFFINGNKEYDRINSTPRIFNNVTFYACNPGFPPANVTISEFQVNANYNEN